MNWSKSHLARWGVEILVFLCYLALYAPWFNLVSALLQGGSTLFLYGKLIFLMLVAWSLAHGLQPRMHGPLEKDRQRSVLFLLVLGVVLVALIIVWPAVQMNPTVQTVAGYLFLGMFFWILGVRKAVNFHTNYQMQQQLFLGTIGIAICFFIAGRLGVARPVYLQSLPFLLFWVPGATIATGLLRAFELQGVDNTERLRSWMNPFLKIVGVSIVIAGLAGGVAPWLFQYIKIPLFFIWQGIRFIFLFLSYWFAYVFQYLFSLIAGLLTDTIMQMKPPTPPEFVVSEEVERKISFFSPHALQVLQWVILAIVVLLVFRLIYFYLMKSHRNRIRQTNDDARESFTSQQALREWGKRQLRRMAATLRQKASSLAGRKKHKSAVDVYHALLSFAARKGIVRPVATTAHSFQSRLQDGFPKTPAETDSIFQAFVRELYAVRDVSDEEVEVLRKNFSQIKRLN